MGEYRQLTVSIVLQAKNQGVQFNNRQEILKGYFYENKKRDDYFIVKSYSEMHLTFPGVTLKEVNSVSLNINFYLHLSPHISTLERKGQQANQNFISGLWCQRTCLQERRAVMTYQAKAGHTMIEKLKENLYTNVNVFDLTFVS